VPSSENRGPKLPPLRQVIARHGLGARKSLGQHFLLDLNLTRRVARAASPLSGHSVIEIGPGPGGLTRGLIEEGADQVIAVEKDERCVLALAELQTSHASKLTILQKDALDCALCGIGETPRKLVSNLPYNVATPLLINWLKEIAEDPGVVSTMVLMFQKEVADRLVANRRSKPYGRLSILTQWLCRVEKLFSVRPEAFTPPPKVYSTVVRLMPRDKPLAPARLKLLERVTAAAFGQRRKMLRQSLKSLPNGGSDLLAKTGITETLRAEDLSIEDFCALARALEESG